MNKKVYRFSKQSSEKNINRYSDTNVVNILLSFVILLLSILVLYLIINNAYITNNNGSLLYIFVGLLVIIIVVGLTSIVYFSKDLIQLLKRLITSYSNTWVRINSKIYLFKINKKNDNYYYNNINNKTKKYYEIINVYKVEELQTEVIITCDVKYNNLDYLNKEITMLKCYDDIGELINLFNDKVGKRKIKM